MKWIFVSLLIVHTLPCILTGSSKRVKIFVPTPVQYVHHTKLVKVPEYHHYFHDHKQQQLAHYPVHNHKDFEMYDRDPALYDDSNYYHGPAFNEFDYYPDAYGFHDRQQSSMLPLPKYLNSIKKNSNKRHAPYQPNGGNGNRKRNPYEPQHFYHQL